MAGSDVGLEACTGSRLQSLLRADTTKLHSYRGCEAIEHQSDFHDDCLANDLSAQHRLRYCEPPSPLSNRPLSIGALAFFSSPLLYNSLPTVRVVTDRNGRSYSVSDAPVRSLYPAFRRNTVSVSTATATAEPPSAHSTYQDRIQSSLPSVRRNSALRTVPASVGKGSMSKVVRGVKNITKGYSPVQVKVRNGKKRVSVTVRPLTHMLSDVK